MIVLSLFDGISCGRVALNRANIPVTKYYASEVDEAAIAISKANHPDIIHLGDVTNWKDWDIDFSKVDLLIGGSPCFRAGTLITTDKGYKKIEDITKGDMVLTHNNRFRKVVLPMITKSNKIYEVDIQGSPKTHVTEEHPYYVRQMTKVWNNDLHKCCRIFSKPIWKKVSDLEKNDFIGFPINNLSENPYNLTEEDCWLLGRYLADGHYRKYISENYLKYQVIYSVENTKLETFQNAVSCHFSCYPHSKSTHRCVVSSKRLVELIELFGLGNRAYNKCVSSHLLNLPKHLAKKVLDGYISGDGYFNKKKNAFTMSSVSKNLIFGLGQLIMKVYRVPYSIFFSKRPEKYIICGRVVNQRDIWELNFKPELKKHTHGVVINDCLWLPFRRKKLLDITDTVYNFEVEEDNSYVANNCIVHNCQGFSIAGKGLNFNDPRSKLFFEYVNILNTIKAKNPNVKFLLENVRMKSEYKDIISEHLGVEPILIDSALISAQRRKRYYWTNIEGVEQPNDKGIMLKDIVHENVDMDKAMSESWCKWFSNKMEYLVPKQHIAVNPDKAITMTARQYSNWQGNFIFECLNQYKIPFDDTLKILEKESKNGKIMYFNKGGQGDRVYLIHGKAITICGEGGGRGAKMGCYLFGCITPDRQNKRQNGGRFNDGQKFYTLTAQDKHGVLVEGYIRKLTPIECERLQTLPDGYTCATLKGKPISDSRRYKALGNGWTVDVIAHILKHMKTN